VHSESKASAQGQNPTAVKAQAKTPAQGTPAVAGTPVASQRPSGENPPEQDVDVTEDQYSAESIPTGQAPAMGSPGLNDRAIGAPPINPAYINPMQSPAQGLSKDDAANTLTRRVVWNDFLRKMNDLGVSAEDVLKAFGSLSEKDLAQPPEKSLDKIVAALGLNAPQAAQAKQYFSELIGKTKSKSLGEEFSASQKQLSVTLASQRDMQRKAILKGIDNLDNNFFMNKTVKPQAQPDQLEQQQQVAIGDDGKPMLLPLENPQDAFSQMEGPSMLTGNGLSAPHIPGGLPQASPLSEASAARGGSEINGLVNQMQAGSQPAIEDKKSIEQIVKNFSSRQMKAAPEMAIAAAPIAAPAAAGMQTVQAPAHASPEALSALNSIFGGGGKDKDSAGDDGDTQGGSQNIAQALTPAEARLGANDSVKGDFQAALAAKNQGPQPMAVPELVQQAHMMVKDGGGDMKVTLHPEGLGEVALRVSVTDGKVNVQMITESDEAKKLIERSIGDLKTGLSQNHLQVDSIKIDTATNLGKQLEQQYQDAQRQQAQAAMEQFRQEGGGQWRRSFFDTGVVNPYHTQGDAPRDTQAPAASRAQSVNGSRRLDLVA
jgi:flagellar hook-length control protein FliK